VPGQHRPYSGSRSGTGPAHPCPAVSRARRSRARRSRARRHPCPSSPGPPSPLPVVTWPVVTLARRQLARPQARAQPPAAGPGSCLRWHRARRRLSAPGPSCRGRLLHHTCCRSPEGLAVCASGGALPPGRQRRDGPRPAPPYARRALPNPQVTPAPRAPALPGPPDSGRLLRSICRKVFPNSLYASRLRLTSASESHPSHQPQQLDAMRERHRRGRCCRATRSRGQRFRAPASFESRRHPVPSPPSDPVRPRTQSAPDPVHSRAQSTPGPSPLPGPVRPGPSPLPGPVRPRTQSTPGPSPPSDPVHYRTQPTPRPGVLEPL